ncbi:hypothetical protein APHWI1_0396 [Anaplasma phagocytophilum str. ApWI1]|uniref:Uncharacterized protein n=1 Tax=Anaplasma phagocytophilum str. ApWI1 TaxID=1359155 RepID=A0A0F3PWQ4_ANAPH|nr:hypothetical protein APHWEB_1120 [Anaplasma phagocytophilum str. Webster]KJV83312.1 hypothetical protein APHHGE2_1192 [Anaplasma phagocytophilum str. HGE2]KJV84457.1 hypothetical protein APHWI1_0396 [Anaplasma phagocytophilum str. ApWI1]KJV98195.1 hypothetical protein OTSANNIE_1164 [Anaplasma phagocytophilum str. Annie]KJZ99981.1 hypothetical protein APHDU1_0187 [Anaplasma phagocytophilum]
MRMYFFFDAKYIIYIDKYLFALLYAAMWLLLPMVAHFVPKAWLL